MKKLSMIVGVISLATLNLVAEPPLHESQPTPISMPAEAGAGITKTPDSTAQSATPPPAGESQAMAMRKEGRILAQARSQLQKDPDIIALNEQIKALLEKRDRLTEEKLLKINPEAAEVFKKQVERRNKVQAERLAQMEAMQAQRKAQPAAANPIAPLDAPAP